MILEYDIPNGTMTIVAETFFLGASRTKIQKMLREYIRSGQADNDSLLIWFQREYNALVQYRAAICKNYMSSRTQLSETERLYQHMRNPCYAVYTKDKEKLKAIKESITIMKKQLRLMEGQIKESKKNADRYQWCMELVKSLE